VRASIEALERQYSDIEELQRKSVDYLIRYTPKIVRNQLNESMNKVLRPLQLKDLFMTNVKPSQLV